MSSSSPFILALGDSLVAGYGLPLADGFTAVLERRLRESRPEASVMNAGVPGNTTGDVLRRLPRLLASLAERPDLAILQVGPNDVLRQVPPTRTRDQLDRILTELARCGIPVLLTTVEPPALLRERASGHLGIHEELAARFGGATVAFFPDGVLGHRDMVLLDRVHPNARAIKAVVDTMLPAVENVIAKGAKAPCQLALSLGEH